MCKLAYIEIGLYYILVSRKASKLMVYVTVPKTNTRGLVENTKVNEKTILKELGKIIL